MTRMMMISPDTFKPDDRPSSETSSPQNNPRAPGSDGDAPKTPYTSMNIRDRGFGRTCPPASPIPLFPHRALRAWPNPGAAPVLYLSVELVLTERFSTDAHFGAYSLPDYPYRLRRDAYAHTGGQYPVMTLVVFDIDCKSAHETARIASDDWFAREMEKVQRLLTQHPGAFIYRTRGGYRLIYRALDGIRIDGEEAEYGWRLSYIRSGTYLAERFNIVIDPTCKSWAWTFRAPHATREPGGPPEDRETFGDPSDMGSWTYVPG